ncbi:hypothetical protein ACFLYP_00355 [Chloroflexota bacterium]
MLPPPFTWQGYTAVVVEEKLIPYKKIALPGEAPDQFFLEKKPRSRLRGFFII